MAICADKPRTRSSLRQAQRIQIAGVPESVAEQFRPNPRSVIRGGKQCLVVIGTDLELR